MKYNTRIGEIDVEEKDIIRFINGLPGFTYLDKFSLMTLKETEPVQWLVSLEDANVSLPVIDPWLIRKNYSVEIPKEAIELLEMKDRGKCLIMCILRIPPNNPEDMTINLLAPIVINIENGKAIQIILNETQYGLRHNLKQELKMSETMETKKGKNTNADIE